MCALYWVGNWRAWVEVGGGVDVGAAVAGAQQADAQAVFDQSQHLYRLRQLYGALGQFGESPQCAGGHAVMAELPQVARVRAACGPPR
jgi:hypothetical protein